MDLPLRLRQRQQQARDAPRRTNAQSPRANDSKEIFRSLPIHPRNFAMAKRQAEEPLEEAVIVDSPASKKAKFDQVNADSIVSSVNGKLGTNGHTTVKENSDAPNIAVAADEKHTELQEVGAHEDQEPEEDGDEPVVSGPIRQDAPTEGYTDLYLDTIDRSLLDFDFEKLCSVTLSNINVYACLVCGKYYQGRGPKSQAYFHALEIGHHVYINMETKKVYVLPEGYEVKSKSLDDIRYVVDPTFAKDDVAKLDKEEKTARDLAGKKYIPGFVGMNNIKANDYFNVIIHALAHVPPLRNFFMLEDLSSSPQLTHRFSTLIRKIWNPRAFKAHVSPHELLQEVALRSTKRFTLTAQSDPVDFLSWFLNHLHLALGGSKTRPGTSIIHRVFQGRMQVESQRITAHAGTDRLRFEDAAVATDISRFLILTLDLPPAPLFQDELDKNIIPQVPLTTILSKYDGIRAQERLNTRLRYRLLHPLPPYLLLHIKRFSANKFVSERNPTIVTFAPRSLDLAPYVQPDPTQHPPGEPIWYDLVANVTHEAVRGGRQGEEGVEGESERKVWRVQVRERAREEWVEVQDLWVRSEEAQTLFTKESYCQIWERRREKGKGKGKGKKN